MLTFPGGQCRILMPRVPSPVVLHLAVVDETVRHVAAVAHVRSP
jgi:hypothetical protein